ncbi:hypothetical protein [Paenibacillus sp. BC26]|uniref:hypothetical protein n=1 Tax=Paenibacillus sp. BC26 TaxID=1881032 RepID=UPI000B8230CD|nr:hypothetical protein [Paenibacillus sp. BC26]
MSKKQKVIVKISVGLNIALIALVAWGYMRINFVKEQILVTEVQTNLVELEGLISNQVAHHWSEPNLVTVELGDVLNGIWLGITSGGQLGTLSKRDKNILSKLYNKLSYFPHDELYKFADLTEEDKVNYEELQKKLREVGLGLNMQVSVGFNNFISQAAELVEKIEVPLQ